MMFYNFLCQKLESVGLSKIVLESFPDYENFHYLLQKMSTKETPSPREDTITLEGLQKRLPPKLIEAFRA